MRPDSRLISVDIDFACVKNVDAVAAHLGLADRACGLCANFWHLPFTDAVFDCVCTFHGLEESAELTRVVAEAARVLRTGGSFVCAVRRDPYPRHRRYFELFGIDGSEHRDIMRRADLYGGTDDLARLASLAGLQLLSDETYGDGRYALARFVKA
jgi:SAM-dependent methyltransferase